MLDIEILKPFEALRAGLIAHFPTFFWSAIVLVVAIFVGILLRRLAHKRLSRRIEDTLLVNFISRTVLVICVVIGLMFFLKGVGWGTAAGGLLAGAGVSAIILGFAFKDIGENFLAGFFLAFSRPFSIGDLIEVQGIKGKVKAMNFRSTHVRTFDGQDIFVPNAMLIKNPLSNYTRDDLLRYNYVLGLDYGADIVLAMQTVLDSLYQIPELEQSAELKPFIQIEDFGTSTVNLGVYFWVNSFRNNQVGQVIAIRNKVMVAGVSALMKSGFSLPADIVELKIYQEGQPIPIKMMDMGTRN